MRYICFVLGNEEDVLRFEGIGLREIVGDEGSDLVIY